MVLHPGSLESLPPANPRDGSEVLASDCTFKAPLSLLFLLICHSHNPSLQSSFPLASFQVSRSFVLNSLCFSRESTLPILFRLRPRTNPPGARQSCLGFWIRSQPMHKLKPSCLRFSASKNLHPSFSRAGESGHEMYAPRRKAGMMHERGKNRCDRCLPLMDSAGSGVEKIVFIIVGLLDFCISRHGRTATCPPVDRRKAGRERKWSLDMWHWHKIRILMDASFQIWRGRTALGLTFPMPLLEACGP